MALKTVEFARPTPDGSLVMVPGLAAEYFWTGATSPKEIRDALTLGLRDRKPASRCRDKGEEFSMCSRLEFARGDTGRAQGLPLASLPPKPGRSPIPPGVAGWFRN
jgi:hypothetical protein